MTMIKKLIFLSILYLLSFSNLHAKNIEDLIGKTIKISWDGSELKCNYTFFPWKQFASKLISKKLSKKVFLYFFMKSNVLALEGNLGHQNMAYIFLTNTITISPILIILES